MASMSATGMDANTESSTGSARVPAPALRPSNRASRNTARSSRVRASTIVQMREDVALCAVSCSNAIVNNPMFDSIVDRVIVVNCVFLAIDPDGVPGLVAEIAFNIFFVFEFVIRITGMGPRAYFSSNWLRLDFIVVMEGLVSMTVLGLAMIENPSEGASEENISVDISILRFFRVLRPLRALSHVPELQVAVDSLLASAPSLIYICLVYMCYLSFFAALMLMVGVGNLGQECMGAGFVNDDTDHIVCRAESSSSCGVFDAIFEPYDCGNASLCVGGATDNSILQFPNFDNFARSLLTLFRISSLDGWGPALWHLQNAVGSNVVYLFTVLVIGGPCVVTQICIAAMIKNYKAAAALSVQKQKEEEDRRMREWREENRHKSQAEADDFLRDTISADSAVDATGISWSPTPSRMAGASPAYSIRPGISSQGSHTETKEDGGDVELNEMEFKWMMSPLATQSTGSLPQGLADEVDGNDEIGAHLNGMLSTVTGSDSGSHSLGGNPGGSNSGGDSGQTPPKKRFSALLKSMSTGAKDQMKDGMLAGQPSSSANRKDGSSRSVVSSGVNVSSMSRTGSASRSNDEDTNKSSSDRTHSTAGSSDRTHSHDTENGRISPLPRTDEELEELWPSMSGLEKVKAVLRDEPYGRFNQAVDFLIVINMFTLASESYGQGKEALEMLKTASTLFTIVFAAELVLKLGFLGPSEFFNRGRNLMNCLDLAIVTVSIIELVLPILLKQYDEGNGSTWVAARVIRLIRLIRLVKIARVSKRWDALMRVINLLIETTTKCYPLLFLLGLGTFMFTILGMQFFEEVPNDGNFSFKSFPASLAQIILVLGLEDWGDVMDFAVEGTSPYMSLYFVCVVLLANMLLLNLILAAVLEGSYQKFDASYDSQIVVFKLISNLKRQVMHKAFCRWIKNTEKKLYRTARRASQLVAQMFIDEHGPQKWSIAHNSVGEVPNNQRLWRMISNLKGDLDTIYKKQIAESGQVKSTGQQSTKITKVTNAQVVDLPGYAWIKKVDTREVETDNTDAAAVTEAISEAFTTCASMFATCRDGCGCSDGNDDGDGDDGRKQAKRAALEKADGKNQDDHSNRGATRWARWAKAVVDTPLFDRFMMLVVLVNCISMIWNNTKHMKCYVSSGWNILDTICMVLFVVEVWLKAVARGFIRGTHPLVKSSWQMLEIILTTTAFIRDILLASCIMTENTRKVLVIILSLRPLRLVNRIETIHTTIASIIHTVYSLSSLVAIIALLKAMYAVVGLQLFMGQFGYCDDEGFEPRWDRYGKFDTLLCPNSTSEEAVLFCDGAVHSEEGCHDGQTATIDCNGTYYNISFKETWKQEPCEEWINPTFHYDDFGNSFMSTFLFSAGGWGNTMFSAVEFVDYDVQPSPTHSYFPVVYFLIGVFTFNFFLKNLFIALVFETYMHIRSISSTGLWLSHKARRWQNYKQELLYKTKPVLLSTVHAKYKRHLRESTSMCVVHGAHHLIHSQPYQVLITTALVINFFILIVTHVRQAPWLSFVQDIGYAIITVIFVLELSIELVARGCRGYFASTMRCVDGMVTVLSVVDTVLNMRGGFGTGGNCSVLAIMRSIRILRLLRLLEHIPGARHYTRAVVVSFQGVVNICVLICLVTFVAANLGHALFADEALSVKMNYWKQYANFSTMMDSFRLLFVLATGDRWENEMEYLRDATSDGKKWAVTCYFTSFQIVVNLLMMNLFVMIIVDAYEVMDDVMRQKCDMDFTPIFKEAWAQLDPEATGEIRAAALPVLLLSLPEPMGFKGSHGFSSHRMQALKQAIQFSSTTPTLRFTETLVHIYGLRVFDIEEYQRTWRLAKIRTAAVYVQRAYRRIFMRNYLSPKAARRTMRMSLAPMPPSLADMSVVSSSSSGFSGSSPRLRASSKGADGRPRSSSSERAREVSKISDLGL